MAKTIKFNLICDGVPVRTIEDLQNNFSVEDILAYYENGLLLRWLNVRGYNKEHEEVSQITGKEPLEVIKSLITIFHVESDEKKIEEGIYILEYLNERKELNALYDKGRRETQTIINDYESGYKECVREILENSDNVAKIKACIAELVENYSYLLQLHHRELFFALKEKSYLAVMCMLMNEQMRKFYLPNVSVSTEDGREVNDIEINTDKREMYNQICKMITESGFSEKLGDNLLVFAGQTDGYWKDLEPKGKEYMILSMESGNFVRSSGENGGDLGYHDILNKFVITDGIDYKSNSSTKKLLYMEV